MARPLRLEFAGAVYHVTSRGDRREDIYLDDEDRLAWLEILGHVCARFNWVVHAYCQMTNHYHLVVETVDGHLSKGMRQLNGVYTQRFNRRHGLVGHLFQGRYQAILVQKETYLLELARYVVLNPLRAHLVEQPEDWPWSSHRSMIGEAKAPAWLDRDGLLGQFGKKRKSAIEAYRRFVMEGQGLSSPLDQTRHQLLLGDDGFVARHRQDKTPEALREVPKAQRRAVALSLDDYRKRYRNRHEAMARAYLSGAYTMAEIGAYFGVHYMTVSRAVRRFELNNRD
ncbi:transposase [Methylohalobius crimeensis]|uniref:transposase n=1 Tax=Methylohalobius crimeensis TaxID=244365 RepID=UPI00047C9BF7|nr:transposase [Methylohalobius crimeensis]